MSHRRGLAFETSLVLLLLACGGGTSPLAADGGTGGGGDGGGGDGGGGGGGNGGGGGSCTTATLPGDRACVPPTARAGAELTIGVDAKDGCLGCFTTFDPCQVVVSGSQITVSLTTRTCPPPGDQACPAICALPATKCKLPPLAVGTYLVAVTGEGSHNARKLVVTADAKDTSCALSQPGMQPMPLDPSAYSTSCSVDADCASATVGDVCQPCACPNAAIAKSALQAYEGDYRAHDSQCHGTPGISCGVCAPSKATCTIMPNALTGTCELKPGL